MFEGLIEFIEKTLFSLINKLTDEEKSGIRQVEGILSLLLGFAQQESGDDACTDRRRADQ